MSAKVNIERCTYLWPINMFANDQQKISCICYSCIETNYQNFNGPYISTPTRIITYVHKVCLYWTYIPFNFSRKNDCFIKLLYQNLLEYIRIFCVISRTNYDNTHDSHSNIVQTYFTAVYYTAVLFHRSIILFWRSLKPKRYKMWFSVWHRQSCDKQWT